MNQPDPKPVGVPSDAIVTVYQNPWFAVRRRGGMHWVSQGKRAGAVVIARRWQDGRIALLRHDRPTTVGRVVWELPRGGALPGEALQDCALREGREETGCRLRMIKSLGTLYPDTGILESCVGVFLVEASSMTSVDANPDLAERAAVRGLMWLQPRQLAWLLRSELIVDGFTVAAMGLFFQTFPNRGVRP